MPSSISASRWLTAARAIWLLAAALLAYFFTVEVAMRIALPRFSETLQRESRDYSAAVRLRPAMPGGSRSVLVVGNSLLLEGIDRARLTQAMGPAYDAVLYPIEATTYLDWYFGLRKLFAQGARPALLVLCLSATNMLSDATEGELFAHTLMRLEDLSAVVRASHLNLMSASTYFFANRSALLADRAYLHNGLMSRWLPNADVLARYLPIQHPAPLDIGAGGAARVVDRLETVRELSAIHGADFVFLVPPSPDRADPAEAIRSVAGRAGICVLIPYVPGEMPHTSFRDGFHLNPDGAARFTERVARALQLQLSAPATNCRQATATLAPVPWRLPRY
jgi:hypothetical protein